LMYACCKGILGAVEILVKKADVNARAPTGATALHYVCFSGSVECFNLLVSNGAEIRCGKMKGSFAEVTPIQIAAAFSKKDLIKALYHSEAEITENDMQFPRNKQIRLFMKYYGLNGQLLEASKKGYLGTVQQVLARKIKRELKSNVGMRSNFMPTTGRTENTVKIEEVDDENSGTAITIYQGTSSTVGGSMNNQLATIPQKVNFVRMMDVNFKGLKDWTPLHWAVYQNHFQIVELLLKAGADQFMKTSEGKTALDLAKELNRTAMIQILTSPPPQDFSEFLSMMADIEDDDDDLESSESESDSDSEDEKKKDSKQEQKGKGKKDDNKKEKESKEKKGGKDDKKGEKDEKKGEKDDKKGEKDEKKDDKDEKMKEEKKKKKKKKYEQLDEYLQNLGQYVYKGMADLHKKMGEVKDHVENVAAKNTDRVIDAMTDMV